MPQPANWSPLIHAVDDNGLFMIWLYNLPTWLFALLTMSGFVSLSLIGLRLIHRRLNAGTLATLIDNGTVGWFFSGVTVLYGLLLGLLTVATWTNYTQATALASQEAASLAVLYRDLAGYPLPERIQLQTQVRTYTRFIIEQSWPLQRQGFIHDGESAKLLDLQAPLMGFDPTNETAKILHQEAIRTFNSLVELRRLRAESISGSVPGVIWYVVLLGALLTVTFGYLFVVKSFWFHGLLVSLLGAVIGLLIFLIAALDHPYWGEVSVSPQAYELVLSKVMSSGVTSPKK
ncbi:bestrophin-like domain [Spirosoma pollinicola]|uniref:DUF4239 domain-containing protein n=1 Tax=Spirosoma pollinicola TaxID=2057025 RepID=A0A2K8YU27_9BACT|nr:DUF4239 domain-containing protein [Spirosoma pollinicola]AUD01130.1 hypothetical protein CWM47_04430 [Spirosoma pollinicola]